MRSNYVLKGYPNAQSFFLALFLEHEIFDIAPIARRYAGITEMSSALSMARSDYTIVEYEPSHYVNISMLEQLGITRERIQAYCDAVCGFVQDEYFTVYSLRKMGFQNDMENAAPYGDWFLASLLRADKRLNYQRTGDYAIFRKGTGKVSRKQFIVDIIHREESLYMRDLISLLEDDYGVKIDRWDIEAAIEETDIVFEHAMGIITVTW